MIIGIETGGTKVVCAAAGHPLEPFDTEVIPTTSPDQTLDRIGGFVARHRRTGRLDAVGLGTFGPVDLNPSSPTFGVIGATPKHGWEGADVYDAVRAAAGCPVAVDTDVSAAALGEQRWGAGMGLADLTYVTVGTGIGIGAVVGGSPLRGTAHPEAGHITVRRHPDDDFDGVCRLHGDCLEGLASGPAIHARWRRPGADLGDLRVPAVEMEAFYLAQLTSTLLYVLSPARIVLGGGVLNTSGLLDTLRRRTAQLLNGALGSEHPAQDPTSGFLTPPGLGGRAGVVGALTMAADLAEQPDRVTTTPAPRVAR